MREVAGPNAGLAPPFAALGPHMNGKVNFLAPHMPRHRGFFVTRHGASGAGDFMAANINCQPVTLDQFAWFANRHHNPTPIGIRAGNSGFDQRWIADRQANAAGGGVIFGAFHVNGDQLAHPFTIAGGLHREVLHHRQQPGAKGAQAFILEAAQSRAGEFFAATGKQQTSIRGRGVAIDGQAI